MLSTHGADTVIDFELHADAARRRLRTRRLGKGMETYLYSTPSLIVKGGRLFTDAGLVTSIVSFLPAGRVGDASSSPKTVT